MGGRRDAEAFDVENVVPLCRVHHTEGHTIGWRTFEARYGVDLKREAVRTWAHWDRFGYAWLAG